jgi:hypothetical protein
MGGRLYAVGGRIDGNYSRNLTSNEAYDPATDRWEQHAPMPTARSGIAAAVLEGRMLVFGSISIASSASDRDDADALVECALESGQIAVSLGMSASLM